MIFMVSGTRPECSMLASCCAAALSMPPLFIMLFFFFNHTATTEIYTAQYTLSLHDALPIYVDGAVFHEPERPRVDHVLRLGRQRRVAGQHVDLRHERLQARHRLGAAAAD